MDLINIEDAKKARPEELFEKLSSGENGIPSPEARKRQEQSGFNEIPEKRVNPFFKLLGYFWGPIPWLVEIAAVLSAVIRHWEDFYIISALLLINAVVGFWQEHKAGNAIEMLKKRLSPKARVRRDGKWSEIASRELVPGDVVRLRLGDILPADVKLTKGDYLLVDESALTGESLPVEKHVSDVAFGGAVARQGEMDALVFGTGLNSYIGRATRLVEEAKVRSHFQRALIRIGNYLIALAGAMVAMVVVFGLFRNESMPEVIQFALVLIVAAIPAALPAVLTVTLAVGAVALAGKEAIVSKLVAIEEMAGMDILCSDKTGTITKNELSVAGVKTFGDFQPDEVLLLAALASREEDQDPIDNAVIEQLRTKPGLRDAVERYEVVGFRPFDPVVKRTEAAVRYPEGKSFKVSKGAPQVILKLAGEETMKPGVSQVVETFAHKGYRALGVAKGDDNGKWLLAGILALYDPPREDSAETIKSAQALGVDVKMVTGDHTAIAKEISSEVNLGTNIISASDLLKEENRKKQRDAEEADGFSEVFPEHKYNIVEDFQEKGHIVGMTGDGVNDAPALKKADVGIAVAGATDAAKSAADIVFTKPGLSVIVDAIKESRRIFERMNSYAVYRIAETVRVLLFLTLSIILFKFYPVTAAMIVILAMLNDLPIMTIAYDNARPLEKAVTWNMRRVLVIATLLGVLGVIASFLLLWIGDKVLHLDRPTIQTMIFLKLAVAGHLTIYLTRTRKEHFWARPFPSAILFFTTETTQLVGTVVAVYGIFMHPLGWKLAGFVWVYSLTFFMINDLIKISFYRRFAGRE